MQAVERNDWNQRKEWELIKVIDTPVHEAGSKEFSCPASGVRIVGHKISTIEIFDERTSTLLTGIETLARDVRIHSYDSRTRELVESHVPLYSKIRRARVWKVPVSVRR